MLSKLKYVGVSTEDLIDIYTLFIRSRAEYLSVVWHSSLTVQQTNKIENIQRTSLKIILRDNYVDYPAALEMTALQELSLRRQRRCLAFAKTSLRYPIGQALFPRNPGHAQNVRTREKYAVNLLTPRAIRKVPSHTVKIFSMLTTEQVRLQPGKGRMQGPGGGGREDD